MIKIGCVVGARPNFMKIAPLLREFKRHSEFSPCLVHTGQHYDVDMSDAFFKDLEIAEPDYHLNVGSGSHAYQTARVLERFEKVCIKENFHRVVVVGDVNSTMACTLAAVKLHIPVAHIEAGLRSFDRRMPEEINRIVTDSICDMLFVSEPSGIRNLRNEGIDTKKIHFVGNIMIDTLFFLLEKARKRNFPEKLGLKQGSYGLVTLHRPGNVDVPGVFQRILKTLGRISLELPLVFPVHPRAQQRIDSLGGLDAIIPTHEIKLLPPLSYVDNLSLMAGSRIVMTDSGGIQEETTALNIPCLTMRNNTERPVTVELGTNTLVGNEPEKIYRHFRKIMSQKEIFSRRSIENWDGKTAQRIVNVLKKAG